MQAGVRVFLAALSERFHPMRGTDPLCTSCAGQPRPGRFTRTHTSTSSLAEKVRSVLLDDPDAVRSGSGLHCRFLRLIGKVLSQRLKAEGVAFKSLLEEKCV